MSSRPERWFSISLAADTSTAKVYIYDLIDPWWGVSAQDFANELNALDVPTIELHINSPGGDAWDGIAIRNAVRQHKAHVVTVVDGLAASAASFIALAGDEVVMATGSQMMIHDAAAFTFGNEQALRETADILSQLSDGVAGMYAEKAGGTTGEWRDVMRVETWYSAQEAVDAGLADRVDIAPAADDKVTNAFDLSVFTHAGRSDAPPPTYPGRARVHTPPAEPVDHHPSTQGDGNMPNIPTGGLSERLGVSAEASEETILAALDEALTERAEPKLPEGTVAISQSVLTDLQNKAVRGDEAREQQMTEQRENAINLALSEGRIKAVDAEEWRGALTDNFDRSVKILNSLAKGTVPVAENGHGGDAESEPDPNAIRTSAAYQNWSM